MTKGKKIDVLFCGLIREIEMFKKSISDLVYLKNDGLINKIIFSTWDYEIKKFPEVIDFLKKNKIDIVETEEPKDRGHGNIWCQMLSMERGMEKITSDFVLKTRSDTYIMPEFIKKLILNKDKLLRITKPLPKGNVFQHKVWIVWYEITRPFYIADECFFGYVNDMKKLINYDERYDKDFVVGAGISHIRRFINPFLDAYPVLHESFGKYNDWNPLKIKLKHFLAYKLKVKNFLPLRKAYENNRFKNLNKKLNDDSYLDLLAAYYSILYSHFYIDGDSFPKQVTFKEPTSPRVKLDTINIDDNFAKNKTAVDYGGQIHDYNMKLLSNICEKKIEKTNLGERLMEAIDRFNAQ